MTEFEKALNNPASFFKSPQDVVAQKDFSRENKIEILRRWEYDQRELLVAEEENMPVKHPNNRLKEILQALSELGVDGDADNSSPTKQGGS